MTPLGSRSRRTGTGRDHDGAPSTGDLDEPIETARKLKHIAKLLESVGAPYSEDLAAAWIAPFNDETDPSFTVEQWLSAGWRDPRLVGAAVGIFGSLERAQRGMALLGIDPGSPYQFHLIRLMLEARELLQRAS